MVGKPKRDKQVNRRLYKCDSCFERRMVSWVELNRASKPKCMKCGNTRLELVSEDAKDDQACKQDVRSQGTHGSFKLSSELED